MHARTYEYVLQNGRLLFDGCIKFLVLRAVYLNTSQFNPLVIFSVSLSCSLRLCSHQHFAYKTNNANNKAFIF